MNGLRAFLDGLLLVSGDVGADRKADLVCISDCFRTRDSCDVARVSRPGNWIFLLLMPEPIRFQILLGNTMIFSEGFDRVVSSLWFAVDCAE